MSWNQFEHSTADGRPVTLYEFVRGDVLFYRYTNADKDIDLNGHVWKAQAISDSGLSVGSGDNLDVIVPSDNPVARLFRGVSPSRPVRIRIYRWHVDDTSAEFKTVWIGTIKEAKREAIDRTRLVTASLASTFTRVGLRLTYGRACPYALYDHNCNVDPASFGVSGFVIDSLDGAEITVTLLPAELENGWFTGGYVEWATEGITERRGLKVQDGNVIGVIGGTSGLSEGLAITLFPGCNRTISQCAEKFSNHLNYGGQPHMPGKSPFTIIKLF